ncbi:MAG: alpha/beta hydrolase [Clostridia bacterium]|jgi:pimeloyl-ACP methyl ester carboxylesterase|nr:alpha/beta hydrolase [Clostridia bacterium]
MKMTIDGVDIHFEAFGNGEPILCLHGWNEDGSVFKSKAYKALLKDCQVYAIDLPGFGKSGGLEHYSFPCLNELLERFAAYIGLEDFQLLGQCMGGILALDYAIRHPERVRKLVLVETMIYFPAWLNLLLIKHLNSWVLKWMLKRKLGLRLLELHPAFKNSRRDKRLSAMLEKVDIAQSIEYIRLMKRYSRYDHIERSKNLKMPVTIITTVNTFRQVKKTAEDLSRVLENVRRFTVPGKNHLIYVD